MRRWLTLAVCGLMCALGSLAAREPGGRFGQPAAAAAQPPPAASRAQGSSADSSGNPQREAYFGDLHLHTALSIDAYITGTRTLPDDAYRYAKGEAIEHVSGERVRLRAPLDFVAVTDHGELLGVARAMDDPTSPLSQSPLAPDITSRDYQRSQAAFRRIVDAAGVGISAIRELVDPLQVLVAGRTGWQMVIDAAERHNAPGVFTTFVAYEWSAMPNLSNLHRNVVFRGSTVPRAPFTSLNSNRPEDLWQFLDDFRGTEGAAAGGGDVIAIPHNSNASRGLMFPLEDSTGAALNADYAVRRMRNEPIVELTQAKGTSETHPALAPLDELASFELWGTVVGATIPVAPERGSYVRSAYARGLSLEQRQGFNPYKFGVIGSTDNHDATSAVEEDAFTGGHGNADATAHVRLNSRPSTLVESSLNFSASGLAGVWAEANTRAAIFDALRRKETFATSGTRLRVRFFAGVDFPAELANRPDAVTVAYQNGVTMGGDLVTEGVAPSFFVWAIADPASAPLQKIQVIKVTAEDGSAGERIYDVACAGGRSPDAGHRCPPHDAPVDPASCGYSRERGAKELKVVWRDPDWQRGARAAYYARVLENPTCRWSTWDALRLGQPIPATHAATLEERAWTSPIWVTSAR